MAVDFDSVARCERRWLRHAHAAAMPLKFQA
jgi:hypothetical protein